MSYMYEDYIVNSPLFYQPSNQNSDFYQVAIPDGWLCQSDEGWVYFTPKELELADQGWKIHVSSQLLEAQKTIDIVSKYLFF